MKLKRRDFITLSLALLLAACNSPQNGTQGEETVSITVSAAASLQDAIAELADDYEAEFPQVDLVLNFGSSGSLQQQIEQGAPADVFFSAASKQMEALRDKDLIIEETHQNLLKNHVVLIAPKENEKLADWQELEAEKVSKIALGEPDSVPAGKYGKEVLESLNLYQTLESKLVFVKNVRQVLSYVETGNADAGFVYATDAKLCKNCQEIAIAPEDSHSPIIYPAAVLKSSKHPDAAREFVEFLASDAAKTVFEQYGFLTNEE